MLSIGGEGARRMHSLGEVRSLCSSSADPVSTRTRCRTCGPVRNITRTCRLLFRGFLTLPVIVGPHVCRALNSPDVAHIPQPLHFLSIKDNHRIAFPSPTLVACCQGPRISADYEMFMFVQACEDKINLKKKLNISLTLQCKSLVLYHT